MAKAVKFDKLGGPEVLEVRDVEVGTPGPGELRIRVDAIGLNRAEVMFREGAYFYQPDFPSGLGYEAAGTVEEVGPDVTAFQAGDTVGVVPAFLQTDYGTYGDRVLVPPPPPSRVRPPSPPRSPPRCGWPISPPTAPWSRTAAPALATTS